MASTRSFLAKIRHSSPRGPKEGSAGNAQSQVAFPEAGLAEVCFWQPLDQSRKIGWGTGDEDVLNSMPLFMRHDLNKKHDTDLN